MPATTAGAGPAPAVVGLLRRLGLTIGTAESLTGGLVCAALTSVPGASAVVRGGVVAYASEVKAQVLHVDRDVLDREGAVSAVVAAQLAQGVRSVLTCDVGVSTTGVAGPEPADGRPVGTVHVAAAGPWGILGEALALTGDREQIRAASVHAALGLVARGLENLRDGVGRAGYGGVEPGRPAHPDEGEEAL
ncbi:CinA family protein [Fodinibacter luteus]|uniref:CinA family protein n=1 Tax=Fodinibacter luteus TaxID=552064 RepID=A0ABP8KCP4_9MICO